MKNRASGRVLLAALAVLLLVGVAALLAARTHAQETAVAEWQLRLAKVLPIFGHRNWICVVDSAYPAQSRAGIETIWTGGHQLDVVRATLEEIGRAKHVRPIVYCDKELAFVPEADAPGIEAYRADLKKLLAAHDVHRLPHEEIIAKLDDAAKTFNVLILKTDLTLPYTSVFINLDCGYWAPEAEQRMREAMQKEPG